MNFRYLLIFLFALFGISLAFTAEFIPKSFYVIHANGEKSPIISLREKRSLREILQPLVRMRRSGTGGGTGTGSGSGSSSYSSSFASSGAGGANDALYFADNLAAGLNAVAKLAGFPNGIPGGFPGGIPGGIPHPQTFAAPASGAQGGCDSCGGATGHPGPNLHSRFGGDDGVSYSGSAQGAKGVYSASSSSIDSDGNVKYSVKTGKY